MAYGTYEQLRQRKAVLHRQTQTDRGLAQCQRVIHQWQASFVRGIKDLGDKISGVMDQVDDLEQEVADIQYGGYERCYGKGRVLGTGMWEM